MQTMLVVLCLVVLIAIALIIVFRPRPNTNLFLLSTKLDTLFASLDKIGAHLKEDFRTNREESSALAKENRMELNETLRHFKTEMTETLKAITDQNAKASDQI